MKTNPASRSFTQNYLGFFELTENPFPVAPDDANFYFSASIEQIVAELVHGVDARKGFMMLTGDIGLGKTTISRRIISLLEDQGVATALVLHTALQGAALLADIIRDFGMAPVSGTAADGSENAGLLLAQLNDFLLAENRKGGNCAIIIDDAQNLSSESLEFIRMVSNLEADQQKLVQILLVGQPELIERLNTDSLRQLRSRIVIRKQARPLDAAELKDYLTFKLNAAGSQGRVRLSGRAIGKIQRYSQGNFRKINILMDRCLYTAFARRTRHLEARIVAEAIKDLDGSVQRRRRSWKLAAGLSTAGAAAALVAMVIGAGWWHGPGPLSHRAVEVPPSVQSVQPQRSDIGQHKPDQVSPAVQAFMHDYGIDEFAPDMVRALADGQFDGLARRIRKQTGLQLVRLKSVPNDIAGRYGLLRFPSSANGRNIGTFLFWRPERQFDHFYYSYSGQEIFDLQKMLARLGFYKGQFDGVVGRQLMKAVVDFQLRAGIGLTGRPDPGTVFLLAHTREANANG